MSTTTWAWICLALPLAGTLFNSFFGRALPGERTAGWVGTAAIWLSFVAACGAFASLMGHNPDDRTLTSTAWDYANSVGVDAKLTILIDPLAIFMMLVVSGISALIHTYSVTYVWKDKGFHRFFVYLNFFVFSMLLLVMSGNFVPLIIGWAFVGAASYLLISFWFRRTTATRAGIKAFVINVVGDVGLILGTYFIVFRGTQSLDFLVTFQKVQTVFPPNAGDLVAGCILLLVGAFAKSAQVPLHTWLPDAMEGPTPVSALIHAATMVTAGVYLIARMHPLFEDATAAADVGAVIGCLTLIIAATIALSQTDIKRVIAYSTMSQIGYMIMAVSAGAYAAGMFHLYTHAFFKALLFMAAGSIIGAMGGEQSLDRMSGFRKALPFTFVCFLGGGLALSAFPATAGFFSKDDVLDLLGGESGWHWVLYVLGYVGAFLTALYTFRMIFRAFFGRECPEARELRETGHLHHPEHPFNPDTREEEDTDVGFPGPGHYIAERERPMKIAMTVLLVGCIVDGFVQVPFVDDVINDYLRPSFANSRLYERVIEEPSNALTAFGLVVSAVVSVAGIVLAYVMWVRRRDTAPQRFRARFRPLYEFSFHKWYFDELYDVVFVRPGATIGRFAANVFERVVIDGLVNGTVSVVRAGSAVVRAAQDGFLRVYAALLLLGLALVALWFLLQST
jgi:NADH-quinone oxidoreductase subunit L